MNRYRSIGLFIYVSSVLSIAVLAGCASLFSFEGQATKPENRIPVEDGGPYKGVWETYDVIVSYEYKKDGQNLLLTGEANLAGHLTRGFPVIDFFYIHAHLLDENGTIISSKKLLSARNREYNYFYDPSFNHTILMPPEALSLAFSYSGRVRDSGSSRSDGDQAGGVDWSFWKMP